MDCCPRYEYGILPTMSRYGIAGVAATALLILFIGCEDPPTAPSSDRGRHIVPEASEGIVLAQQESGSLAIQTDEEEINPRVELPEDVLFISANDVNLDLDEPDEQIVVIKRRDDPTDRVRLLVADFDTLRSTYRITWEGETLATNVRTFSVSTSDLVGDHIDEIVAVGTDQQGRQTMDVFRRSDENTGEVLGLGYRSVFSVATDGSIEIDSRPRGDAYRTLQSDGVSFPIDVYRQNLETDTPLDLIRTRWSWNVAERRYVQSAVEDIPAVQIEEEQLRNLYDAEAEEFETYIHGPWFRSRGEDLGGGIELAYFDTEEREIVLFHDDRQERYEWLNSYKTLYASGPGLWINVRNNVLTTVRRQLSITVVAADTLRIAVEGVEYWNGNYQRMTAGIQSGILRRYDLETPSFVLDGVYGNESGVEMVFSRPFFHFRSGGYDWSGGYNVVQIDGEAILELKILSYNVAPAEISVNDGDSFGLQFTADYQEQRTEGGSIHRLTLEPIRITVDGIESRGGQDFILEQVTEDSGE